MSIETMAEVSGSISLDFAQRVSPVIVFAKQGDAKTRIINIQPLMNGVPVAIDSTAGFVAKFAEQKPDGYVVYNDSAVINNDGTITVTLSDQSLVAHGKATCCIVLENSDEEKRLTSQNFTLFIEYSAGAYQNLVSADEITSLEDKLEQIQAMIDFLGDEIRPLPEISEEDTGKVLAAEDGMAVWKEMKGGAEVVVADSINHLPDDAADGTMVIIPGGAPGGCTLPLIAPEDNGKVLTAKDGAWVPEALAGGSGDSLPEVTEDDDGKILIVREGEWKIENYGNIRATLEITLKSTDWADNKQTIPTNAISENCTVIVDPEMADNKAYLDSGIMLTEAEVGKMVFECVVPPIEDIAVLVHIIDPLITAEPILSFDSVDEMNAYEAEDGAIAIVPSEGDDALSWYDLEDRPFGEEVVMTNTINWDGADGIVVFDNVYHVSEITPSTEQLIGSSFIVNIDGTDETITITEEIVMVVTEDVTIVAHNEQFAIVVVYADDAVIEEGMTIPNKGVYFAENVQSFTLGYEFETTVVKKIDNKYVPGMLPSVDEVPDDCALVVQDDEWVIKPIIKRSLSWVTYRVTITSLTGSEKCILVYNLMVYNASEIPSFTTIARRGVFIQGDFYASGSTSNDIIRCEVGAVNETFRIWYHDNNAVHGWGNLISDNNVVVEFINVETICDIPMIGDIVYG